MKMERKDEQNKEKKESITALGERERWQEREKKEVKEMSNRERKMERSTGRFISVNYYECYSHKKFLASFEISMSSD